VDGQKLNEQTLHLHSLCARWAWIVCTKERLSIWAVCY